MLDATQTPSAIVRYLDQYVIAQQDAKRIVAVAVYSHFRKIANSRRGDAAIVKSNMLLIGASGTGKTLMCETLSRGLGVPFVTAEATSLAQTRYVDQSAAFARILEQQMRGHVPLAAHAVDRAPLLVLESANMPAVIVEMGYLTNATQERHLTGNEAQNSLVQAIVDAVLRFREHLGGST